MAAPHRRSRSVLAALGLAVALVRPGAGEAQVPRPPVGAMPGQSAPFTPLEQEALRLYNDNRLLTARTKADEALARDPDSIVGHYVLGQILRRAEGALPKAMKHLGRARELYEEKYQPTVANLQDTPWLLHREILYAAQTLAGELERHEYQLQLLDYNDSLYDPRPHWPSTPGP